MHTDIQWHTLQACIYVNCCGRGKCISFIQNEKNIIAIGSVSSLKMTYGILLKDFRPLNMILLDI